MPTAITQKNVKCQMFVYSGYAVKDQSKPVEFNDALVSKTESWACDWEAILK